MNASAPQLKESRDYRSEEWWTSSKSDDSYNDSCGNRNLSAVIERICDDGSVQAGSKQKDLELELELDLGRGSKVKISPEKKSKKHFVSVAELTNKSRSINLVSSMIKPQKIFHRFIDLMILMLVIALVIGFYYLYSQNQKFKVMLNDYEDKIKVTYFAQDETEQILSRVDFLNERISDVSQTVESIRDECQDIDNKIEISMVEKKYGFEGGGLRKI